MTTTTSTATTDLTDDFDPAELQLEQQLQDAADLDEALDGAAAADLAAVDAAEADRVRATTPPTMDGDPADDSDLTDRERRIAAASTQPHPITQANPRLIATPPAIAAELEQSGGEAPKPLKSHQNLTTIFAGEFPSLAFDERRNRMVWAECPPTFRGPTQTDADVTDTDIIKMTRIVCGYYGDRIGAVGQQAVRDAAMDFATHPTRTFDPWRAHYEAVEWDGETSIEEWIPHEYLDGGGSEVNVAILRDAMLRLAAITEDPGRQDDYVTALSGGQGTRKNSVIRAITDGIPRLVGGHFETMVIPDADRHKDALLAAHSSVITVLDELGTGRGHRQLEDMKGFISSRADTVRVPYGHYDEIRKRKFVLFATTNDDQYLDDPTGARRYQNLRITDVIPSWAMTREVMDSHIAEARDRYRAGERPGYGPEFEALIAQSREGASYDPVGEALDAWLHGEHRSRTERSAEVDADTNILGKIIPVDKITPKLLKTHVPGLTRSALGLSDRDITSRIRAYLNNAEDYEHRTSARGVYSYPVGRPVKDVWVRVTEETDTGATAAPDAAADTVGADGAPTTTVPAHHPRSLPVQSPRQMDPTSCWYGRAAEVREWADDWCRRYGGARDGAALGLETLDVPDGLLDDLTRDPAAYEYASAIDDAVRRLARLAPAADRAAYLEDFRDLSAAVNHAAADISARHGAQATTTTATRPTTTTSA